MLEKVKAIPFLTLFLYSNKQWEEVKEEIFPFSVVFQQEIFLQQRSWGFQRKEISLYEFE